MAALSSKQMIDRGDKTERMGAPGNRRKEGCVRENMPEHGTCSWNRWMGVWDRSLRVTNLGTWPSPSPSPGPSISRHQNCLRGACPASLPTAHARRGGLTSLLHQRPRGCKNRNAFSHVWRPEVQHPGVSRAPAEGSGERVLGLPPASGVTGRCCSSLTL